MYFYCIVFNNMFRPLKWPSAGFYFRKRLQL